MNVSDDDSWYNPGIVMTFNIDVLPVNDPVILENKSPSLIASTSLYSYQFTVYE